MARDLRKCQQRRLKKLFFSFTHNPNPVFEQKINLTAFDFPGCKFPVTWNGTWFLMRPPPPATGAGPQQQQQQQQHLGNNVNVSVGTEDFGSGAFCYREEERGAKYVLFDR